MGSCADVAAVVDVVTAVADAVGVVVTATEDADAQLTADAHLHLSASKTVTCNLSLHQPFAILSAYMSGHSVDRDLSDIWHSSHGCTTLAVGTMYIE